MVQKGALWACGPASVMITFGPFQHKVKQNWANIANVSSTILDVGSTRKCICYSYTMHGHDDMYTRSLRAEGVHIRQTTNAHGITVMCHIASPLAN